MSDTYEMGPVFAVPDEQWKDIPGFESSYQASSLGRVRSLTRNLIKTTAAGTVFTCTYAGRILKPAPVLSGHLNVMLGRTGGAHRVHALVLRAFVGPRPAGMETRHLDGNEQNNCLVNLEYATRSRNLQDRKWHRSAVNCTLTPADVFDIRHRLLRPIRGVIRTLAREYHVSPRTISHIKAGRIHADCVPCEASSTGGGA
jgi:hypothetical protein